MFKNKHVIIALIVTPILAALAWIGVGQLMGEKPHAARPGQSYPLVEKSNCRYESGACDLENEDFLLRLTFHETEAAQEVGKLIDEILARPEHQWFEKNRIGGEGSHVEAGGNGSDEQKLPPKPQLSEPDSGLGSGLVVGTSHEGESHVCVLMVVVS